jgi:hypothetical protein
MFGNFLAALVVSGCRFHRVFFPLIFLFATSRSSGLQRAVGLLFWAVR